jgi:hypothetical protein
MVVPAVLPAYAQVDYSTATLRGTVFDPQGAVVAGAQVSATNLNTGVTKNAVAGSDGAYQIPMLPPGAYEISFQAKGFSKEIAKSVTLTVGESAVYDAHLKVGGTSEVVEVTGESAPVIQVEQTQQANTITQTLEENIPNVARDYSQAIQYLPGISNANLIHQSGSQRAIGAFPTNNFTTAGGNGRGGLVTIDGGENDYGSGNSRATHISPDAIQELQVNRNSFNAEFGFTLAEHVNITTRSGGNKYHGSAYGYFRDQVTDAKPFFRQSIPGFNPNHSIDQDDRFGGTFGGSLVKDKLFFFANYEYNRTTTAHFKDFVDNPLMAGLNDSTDPSGAVKAITAAQRGYLATLAPLQQSQLTSLLTPSLSPIVQQLIAGQSGQFLEDSKWHDGIFRLDYQPRQNDTITARFLHERQDFPLAVTDSVTGAPNGATNTVIRDYELLTSWTHVFSPTLLNALRVQLVPDTVADVGYNNPFGGNTLPNNVITGFISSGPNLGSNGYFSHQRRYQFEDSVSWTHGKHTIKFGESYRPVKYSVANALYANSLIAYTNGTVPLGTALTAAGLSGFPAPVITITTPGPTCLKPPCITPITLTGLQAFSVRNLTTGAPAPQPVQLRSSFGNSFWTGWSNYGGVYVQDSWKPTTRLTIDAGARFDVDSEAFPNQSSNFYVSPRLGVSYDLLGDHKTVIRAGGGVFVAASELQAEYYSNLYNPDGSHLVQTTFTAGTDPAFGNVVGKSILNGNLPLKPPTAQDYANAGVPVGVNTPHGVFITNPPTYKNNYSIQASLSIDRELGRNMSLEVGYNMQHTVHLQDPIEVGYIQDTTKPIDPLLGPMLTVNPATNKLVPGLGGVQVPLIETLTNYCACGGAIYHAGTISLTRRMANHLQFQTNYTFGKSIDDVLDFSSFNSSFYPTIPGKDRAISPYNITHSLTGTLVYTTPFHSGAGHNWVSRALADITLSPVVNTHSGIPFELFIDPGQGLGHPALPFLPNPTGTFATPPTGNGLTQEAANQARPFNAPRNSGIGAWFYRTDFRLSKDFYVNRDRGFKVAAIATASNIFNHTNFTGVNGDFPGVTNSASPLATNFPLSSGGSVNLLNGPYNLHGNKAIDFTQTVNALGQKILTLGNAPLAFNSADIPRQVQFGLQFSF